MRVIASKVGFFGGNRIRVGQVFDVPEGTTGKWFQPYAEAPKSAESKKSEPKKGKDKSGPTTFSEIAKQDGDAQAPKSADDLV